MHRVHHKFSETDKGSINHSNQRSSSLKKWIFKIPTTSGAVDSFLTSDGSACNIDQSVKKLWKPLTSAISERIGRSCSRTKTLENHFSCLSSSFLCLCRITFGANRSGSRSGSALWRDIAWTSTMHSPSTALGTRWDIDLTIRTSVRLTTFLWWSKLWAMEITIFTLAI